MIQVEICVKGCIDPTWSEWFEGLDIRHITGDQSQLTGKIPDQTALYSILNRLSNLGLPLVSVIVRYLNNS